MTTDDRAFCWGANMFGQLGKGTSEPDGVVTQTPVAVMGTLKFSSVSVAVYHTCGLTTDNRAYCWGGDQWGQLGDGAGSDTCELSQPCRKTPRLVAGGLRFSQLDAGGGNGPGEGGVGGDDGGHTCGVTTDGKAYCWGIGASGQNGDGTLATRMAPRLVAGGLLFRSVNVGIFHVCGVTTDDRAYCWGANFFGQLGDGTHTQRTMPKAVAGGHLFRQVSASRGHTCARTPDNVAYCWGIGSGLGDGVGGSRLRPQPVVGPS